MRLQSKLRDHTYEELRSAALHVLSNHGKGGIYDPAQFNIFLENTTRVLAEIDGEKPDPNREVIPSHADTETFRELFWDLFREGIITLGLNASNPEYPWFRVASYGRHLLENQSTPFFHDAASYERVVRESIPLINDVTLLYLKEAMQNFRSNSYLSCAVMLGVAAEHTFNLLMESVSKSGNRGLPYAKLQKENKLLRKVEVFRRTAEQQTMMEYKLREELDVHIFGLLSIIRTFRNDAGHPTGEIISRDQAFTLLHLFPHYCKRMYQLKAWFEQTESVEVAEDE